MTEGAWVVATIAIVVLGLLVVVPRLWREVYADLGRQADAEWCRHHRRFGDAWTELRDEALAADPAARTGWIDEQIAAHAAEASRRCRGTEARS